MSQTSYPITYSTAPGAPAADIDHVMWRDLFTSLGDGVIDNLGTSTTDCRLIVPSTGNTVTVAPGKVRFKGYELLVTDDGDGGAQLSVPEATSSTLTYSIGVLYNPANQSVVGGPLTMVAQVGEPTLPSGGAYHALHLLARPLGSLAVAVHTDRRKSVGQSLYAADNAGLVFNAPIGTSLWWRGERYARVPSPLGSSSPTGATWVSESRPVETAIPLASGVAAYDSTTVPKQYTAMGRAWLSGYFKKTTGTFAAGATTLGTVPAPGRQVVLGTGTSHDTAGNTCIVVVSASGSLVAYLATHMAGTIAISVEGLSYRLP